MGSDKSLCNGTLDVSVTKKFGQRVQKMVSEECPVKKRCSPRLRKIPEGKKPFYGPPRKASQHHPIDFITSDAAKLESLLELHEKDAVSVAERKIKCPPTSCKPNLVKSMVTTLDASASASASCITSKEHSPKGGLETSDSATDKKSLDCSYVAHTRNDKARVKKALRIYNKYYLHFFQVFAIHNLTCMTIISCFWALLPAVGLSAPSTCVTTNYLTYPSSKPMSN